MFQALFARHWEALHVQQLVYFVCIMSAGCYQGWIFCAYYVGWVQQELDILCVLRQLAATRVGVPLQPW
jgi:hypothetical protein